MAEELELVIKCPSLASLKSFSRNDAIFHQSHVKRKSRELILLEETIKDYQKKRTQVYALVDNKIEVIMGIIALSASRLDDKPALLIDYLFIANEFRYKHSGVNYALPLITFALEKGFTLQKEIGLSNMILYPDNEAPDLIKYYKETYGFNEIQQRLPVQNKIKKKKGLFIPIKE